MDGVISIVLICVSTRLLNLTGAQPWSRELIRETAATACRGIAEIPPFKIDPPYTFEVRVLEGKSIDGYVKRGAVKIDDRTVSWHSDDLRALSI